MSDFKEFTLAVRDTGRAPRAVAEDRKTDRTYVATRIAITYYVAADVDKADLDLPDEQFVDKYGVVLAGSGDSSANAYYVVRQYDGSARVYAEFTTVRESIPLNATMAVPGDLRRCIRVIAFPR